MKDNIFRPLLVSPHFWYEKKTPWWHFCLKPFAVLYVAILKIRRFFYQSPFFKSAPFSIPVIVVGNLTVGGSGKTPFVIWLVQKLKEAGYRPGIISRGYGGASPHYPLSIHDNTPVEWTGDEPRLLYKKTGCPVVVAPRRKKAAEHLQAHTDCNIIVSDDGLQHYALYRDITVVLLDGHKRIGNGYALPAGPLREPLDCLQQGVLKVCKDGLATPGEWQATTCYANTLVSLDGDTSLSLEDLLTSSKVHTVIHAVAGIAHPEYFFEMLEKQGLPIVRHAFPDHHPFQDSDFSFVGQDSYILMTEKDAVKCRQLDSLKQHPSKSFYWPITLELETDFWQNLLSILKTIRVSGRRRVSEQPECT